MSLPLIDAKGTVDPIVIAATIPKIISVMAVNIASGKTLTPVIDAVYKTGPQHIRIEGTNFPVVKLAEPVQTAYKFILVTRDGDFVKTEHALNNYVYSATTKEIICLLTENANANGAGAYLELRSEEDRPVATYDLEMVATP